MGHESFEVRLIFDNDGDLIDVEPLMVSKTPEGNHVKLETLTQGKMNKISSHTLMFSWGSPGCVIFKTKTGYVRIC